MTMNMIHQELYTHKHFLHKSTVLNGMIDIIYNVNVKHGGISNCCIILHYMELILLYKTQESKKGD